MSSELRSLGKYELLELLGQGGMGDVWKAFDPQLQRYVAIKLLNADLRADPDFVARFTHEAQLVASLRHPNIVQLHDFQFSTAPNGKSTIAYMVMDYVEGETLADYIASTSRRGQFPPVTQIVNLFTSISLAIDYAHQRGMVHRDIKPANILLDRRHTTRNPMGEPVLTDFGIAKLQGAATLASSRMILGTPLYTSPEQAQGKQGDGRSDLYSLGIILYEVLTGVTPFRGDNPFAILVQHFNAMPTPPASINPGISPALSEVVLRSIAKDPNARFQSASALTIAVAEAFEVPVPIELRQHVPGEDAGEAQAPYLTAPPSLDKAPGSPLPSRVGAGLAPTLGAVPGIHDRPMEAPAPPPVPVGAASKQRRLLPIALIGLLIVALLGSGVAAFLVLSQKSVAPPVAVVGHISFVNSGQRTAQGTLAVDDELQIDLQHIPPPPAGRVYYAWLESNTGNEGQIPLHWTLPISSNGTLHYLYPGDGKHTNLLSSSSRFLVTVEDGTVAPTIPNPDFSKRLYYTVLPRTQTPTAGNQQVSLNVMPCPASSTSSVCA